MSAALPGEKAPEIKPVEPARFVLWDSPVLWTSAPDVTDIIGQVHPHIEPMREAMRHAPQMLLGIAAPQIGISLRFFCTAYKEMPVVINPLIVDRAAVKDADIEGCASYGFPIRFCQVKRHRWVKVRFTDGAGQQKELKLFKIAARVFQHEFDHLNGINIWPRSA